MKLIKKKKWLKTVLISSLLIGSFGLTLGLIETKLEHKKMNENLNNLAKLEKNNLAINTNVQSSNDSNKSLIKMLNLKKYQDNQNWDLKTVLPDFVLSNNDWGTEQKWLQLNSISAYANENGNVCYEWETRSTYSRWVPTENSSRGTRMQHRNFFTPWKNSGYIYGSNYNDCMNMFENLRQSLETEFNNQFNKLIINNLVSFDNQILPLSSFNFSNLGIKTINTNYFIPFSISSNERYVKINGPGSLTFNVSLKLIKQEENLAKLDLVFSNINVNNPAEPTVSLSFNNIWVTIPFNMETITQNISNALNQTYSSTVWYSEQNINNLAEEIKEDVLNNYLPNYLKDCVNLDYQIVKNDNNAYSINWNYYYTLRNGKIISNTFTTNINLPNFDSTTTIKDYLMSYLNLNNPITLYSNTSYIYDDNNILENENYILKRFNEYFDSQKKKGAIPNAPGYVLPQ